MKKRRRPYPWRANKKRKPLLHIVGSPPAKLGFCIPKPLDDWLRERAVILGVSKQQLVSDVLTRWAALVQQDELEHGIDYDAARIELPNVAQPYDGYARRLLPRHRKPSHLEPALQGMEIV